METMNRYSLVSLCIVLLISSKFSIAEEAETSQKHPLVVELEAQKPNVIVGEPVYITARLRNSGSGNVQVPMILEFQSLTLRLQITHPNGKTIQFSPLFYADTIIPNKNSSSNEKLEQVLPIFFGSNGWTFPRPGTYQLALQYEHKSATNVIQIESEAISVMVNNEEATSEILVNDSMSSIAAGKFMFWQQGDHLTEGILKLNKLVEQHPDTILANYARLALARNISRGFRNYAVGKFRKADCQLALELFSRVKAQQLPTYLKNKMVSDVERCTKKT